MSAEHVRVNPMFEKDQPQRILSVVVHRVQEATGFLSGPLNVVKAQGEGALDAVRPDANAANDDEHELTLVTARRRPGTYVRPITSGYADVG